MKKIIIALLILVFIVFLYGKYIEVNNLEIKEYTIKTKDVPDTFKELKLVHFSDVLYNPENDKTLDKLVKEINELEADIIVFSGDLFSNNYSYKEDDYKKLQKNLNKLEASLYKYAVIGDNDKKHLEEYKDILYESSFVLLDNENTLLFYKDSTPINVIGLSDTNNIEKLLETDVPSSYNLAITHKPDNIKEISNYDIDLVMSGHSLGGVINIPFYGGLLTKDGAKTYINDYYKLNTTEIYISNGIGNEKFNFRLGNTPSINVYRFSN